MCSLLLAAAAPAAEAQDAAVVAHSFEQLAVLVRPGDTVSVTDAAGSEFSGRIELISDVSLALLTDDGPREWSEADVQTVRQRQGDSLKTGALWGLGLGAMLGAAVGAAECKNDDYCPTPVVVAAGAGFIGGLGAAFGALYDAGTTTHRIIYESPGSPDVSLSPVVTRTRRSVLVSLSF